MASFVNCNSKTSAQITRKVDLILSFLHKYRWIIEAYVSDFYTHDHWSKLPNCVREYIDSTNPPNWAWMLEKEDIKIYQSLNQRPVPLTLMALKACANHLSINRIAVDLDSSDMNTDLVDSLKYVTATDLQSDKSLESNQTKWEKTYSVNAPAFQPSNYKNGQCMDMQHLFRRHVKPKKQHEIQKLGQVINLLSEMTSNKHVIDIGAGLGHLSRILTFCYGLKVITVEADGGHAPKASDLDRELKKDVLKKKHKAKKLRMENFDEQQPLDIPDLNVKKNETEDEVKSQLTPLTLSSESDLPSHIICRINHNIASSQLLEIVKEHGIQSDCGPDRNNFILTGLHACGDLSPSLLRIFVQCSSATALASVGCCYMKMDHLNEHESDDSRSVLKNYPMSHHLRQLPNNHLNYECREMACHFADAYCQRLKENPPNLKVHSYRAALQDLITQVCPTFQSGHQRLVTKKGTENSFRNYAFAIFKKLNIDENNISEDSLQSHELLTEHWKRVVAFYTIRLSLAPVIESLLLLDRLQFLNENGVRSALVPIFDSTLSPRNFVILAVKS